MKIPRRVEVKDLDLTEFAANLFDKYGEQPEALTASAEMAGSSFVIPVLVPIGVPTGDGRKFMPGSLSTRDLPLPLMWQIKSGPGHDQSVLVGRIDALEITDSGIVQVEGTFDTGVYGREAERLVRGGFLRGVSADIDNFTATEEEVQSLSSKKVITSRKVNIDFGRLSGATLVNIPAFQHSKVHLAEEFVSEVEKEYVLLDGEFSSDMEETALVASAFPVAPPKEWFNRPNISTPTPIEVTEEGRVFGYLALWESAHIGMAGKVKPPRSSSKYRYFRVGKVLTEDGSEVFTGPLTLVGGHAPLNFNARQAASHYDNTNSATADVSVGEDQFGIWVAGAVRPEVTPSQIRSMRASGISGDWRPINGKLELVRACFVNTPGFMTTRALVASGQVQALVAAGTETLEQMRLDAVFSDRFGAHLDQILSRLDYLDHKDQYDDAYARLSAAKQEFEAREKQELDDAVLRLKEKFNTN